MFMDKECIALCDAINRIPGLDTVESCCGHGKKSFRVFLHADDVLALYWLARSLSRSYGPPHLFGWELVVTVSDISYNSNGDMRRDNGDVVFMLTSGDNKGKKAYEQANELAKYILDDLNSLHLQDWFNKK